MSARSIDENVVEELVTIRRTVKRLLPSVIGNSVHEPRKFLNEAERQAIREGNSLEVSWATTTQGVARRTRNALIQAYVDRHGRQARLHGQNRRMVPWQYGS